MYYLNYIVISNIKYNNTWLISYWPSYWSSDPHIGPSPQGQRPNMKLTMYYMYIYVCVYIYICVCVYVHIYMSVYVHIYVCVYVHIYMCVWICTCICVCICTYICVCICTYICTYWFSIKYIKNTINIHYIQKYNGHMMIYTWDMIRYIIVT